MEERSPCRSCKRTDDRSECSKDCNLLKEYRKNILTDYNFLISTLTPNRSYEIDKR